MDCPASKMLEWMEWECFAETWNSLTLTPHGVLSICLKCACLQISLPSFYAVDVQESLELYLYSQPDWGLACSNLLRYPVSWQEINITKVSRKETAMDFVCSLCPPPRRGRRTQRTHRRFCIKSSTDQIQLERRVSNLFRVPVAPRKRLLEWGLRGNQHLQ